MGRDERWAWDLAVEAVGGRCHTWAGWAKGPVVLPVWGRHRERCHVATVGATMPHTVNMNHLILGQGRSVSPAGPETVADRDTASQHAGNEAQVT